MHTQESVSVEQLQKTATRIAVNHFFTDLASFTEAEVFKLCCDGLEESVMRGLVLREAYSLLSALDVAGLVQEHKNQTQGILVADLIH